MEIVGHLYLGKLSEDADVIQLRSRKKNLEKFTCTFLPHAIYCSVYSVLAVNSFYGAVSPARAHFLHDTQAAIMRAAAVAPFSAGIHQGVSSLSDGLNLPVLSCCYCL